MAAWAPAVLYDAAEAMDILHVGVIRTITTTSRVIGIYCRRHLAYHKIWG